MTLNMHAGLPGQNGVAAPRQPILPTPVGTPAALPESLNIVALDDILLHEDADAARAEPLVHAMACDGVQRHPVILAHTPEGLLVQLDGANRITALRRLGCQHVVAQVVDYADPAAVHLYTWMHLTCLPLPQKGHGTAVWQALAVEPVPPAHAWLTQTPSANAAVVFALLRKADVITLVVELGMTLPAGLTRIYSPVGVCLMSTCPSHCCRRICQPLKRLPVSEPG